MKTNGRDIYNPEDIDYILDRLDVPEIKTSKKIVYYNVPCAFDIETTSFYDDGEKRAIMYEWTFGIDDYIVIGRTWDEFMSMTEKISKRLNLHEERRLVVYVHNLAFEFGFISKRFEWKSVFASEQRKPIYALTESGIEFRCSYFLSGYNLETLGKTLHKYPVQKMVGDLDYSLIRHSNTPLTEKEIGYCVNDVRVVISYIREKMEQDGNISRIPLTKTGYVRRHCKNACFYAGNSHKKNGYKFLRYRDMIKELTIDSDEYAQLKRAFQGGFTHANAFYTDRVIENVKSYDFTSSYPAVMISEKFPMSKAELYQPTDKEDFEKQLRLYCCLFDIEFTDISSKTLFEHPISRSRCFNVVGVQEDNGRVVKADSLQTTLTEQDFDIIKHFYKWKSFRVKNFRRYKKSYLPKDFVLAILELYQKKTELKGVEGREDEYLNSKEMLNSCYGMSVTDIVRDENVYNGTWATVPADVNKCINEYNGKIGRFLFYPWGVWVTAYARHNLFTGICVCGRDYIYSDTDSLKIINYERHASYFERYNDTIQKKIVKALETQKIDVALASPSTVDGKTKPLGVWDDEGVYDKFKTLGAKRYCVEKNGKISITLSGVNKKCAVPYLMQKYGRDGVFDAFTDELIIPAKNDLQEPIFDDNGIEIKIPTGKNTHTYLDDEYSGTITDYLGNAVEYHEYSGVHLEACAYEMSLSSLYIDYLKGIKHYNK